MAKKSTKKGHASASKKTREKKALAAFHNMGKTYHYHCTCKLHIFYNISSIAFQAV
jgi:hypothetical protein